MDVLPELSGGSQAVYGISKTIVTNIIKYSLNMVVLTIHRLAGSTQMWCLSADVHADVVFADVEMCLVQFRSCDHAMQMAIHS